MLIPISVIIRYRDDEDDSDPGSGEEEDLYSRENDGGVYNTHRLQEESINVVSCLKPSRLPIGCEALSQL